MTWLDLLAWVAGIGSLLYFMVALLKPVWFLGVPSEEPNVQEDYKSTLVTSKILR